MEEMVEVGDNNTIETTEVKFCASIYIAIYLPFMHCHNP
jgi:hypothetical protein